MNSWELNKVAGAVLGTLVFGMGLGVLAEVIFEQHPPEEPGYEIAIAEPTSEDTEAAPAGPPFAVLLASASVSAGEQGVRVCGACHTFEEGGPNKVGPNLHGVVGAPVIDKPNFNYSGAMKAFGEGKTWTYDELNHFLESPQGYIPGTAMSFGGIKDDEKRADVIVYLKSISPDAPPLPEPPAEVASADSAGDTASDASSGGGTAPAPSPQESFLALVAASDPAEGERNTRACQACHSFQEGGPTMVGPNLYGVAGEAIAHKDYAYSNAMKSFAQEHGTWTAALLGEYLANPLSVVPGTKMAFAGVKNEQDRAEVVAYLRSISPNAPPLEQAAESAAAPAAAEAGEDAAAAPPAAPAAPAAPATGASQGDAPAPSGSAQ